VNKSEKRQEATHLPYNETHVRRSDIDLKCTYRLGICGFRIRGDRQLVPALREAVHMAFREADGRKLLLLPGHWKSWPTLDEIAGIAKGAELPILFETSGDATKAFFAGISRTGKRLPLKGLMIDLH
jgi:hypothetical protein